MKQEEVKILMDRHEWRSAIPILKVDIEENPSDPWSHMYMGSCYYELGEYSQALKWFEKAEALLPDNPTPIGLQGDALFAKGMELEAGELYKKAFNMDENNDLAEKNLRRWLKIVRTENHPIDRTSQAQSGHG